MLDFVGPNKSYIKIQDFTRFLIVPTASTTTITITGIIAVMAAQACEGGKTARVAITTGRTFVVNAVIFTTCSGMR